MGQKWREENPDKMKAYRRKWYLENRESEIKKAREREIIKREKFFQHIKEVKKSGCIKCGEKHPGILDFHHRNGEDKEIGITNMKSYGMKKINEEIVKCDVLCSNCHRILHYNERWPEWSEE